MLTQNIYYQEERKYASDRFLALVVLTLLAFLLSGQSSGGIAEKSVLTGFVLLALTLFSMAHYYFISVYPSAFVAVRKNLLIFLDLAVLTFLIHYLRRSWTLPSAVVYFDRDAKRFEFWYLIFLFEFAVCRCFMGSVVSLFSILEGT